MSEIWNLINANSDALNVVANVLMLAIWALYFQLLLNTYRHRLRPKILINRAAGCSLDSRCIITNMSEEKIYLESVLMTLAEEKEERTFVLSEYGDIKTGPTSLRSWFQGPLSNGELADIGSYRSLIERALGDGTGQRLVFSRLEMLRITVVATYTAEDQLIGAEREFDISGPENRLSPRHFTARQSRSGRRRADIERFMLRHARGADPQGSRTAP